MGANIELATGNAYTAPGLLWNFQNGDGNKSYLWSFIPSDTAKGPFVASVGDYNWNGTLDTCMYVGYNIGPGGTPLNTAEPYFGFVIEQDYFVNGQHLLEAYFEWRGPTTHTRPIMFGWDKDTEQNFGMSIQVPNIQRVATANSSTVINAWTESELWMKGQQLLFGNPGSNLFGQCIEINATGTNGIAISGWNTYASGQYPRLRFLKSESNVIGTHTALHTNNGIGAIEFWGSDGTQFVNSAYINAVSDGAASTGKVPSRITLSTTNANGTMVEGLRLDSAQQLTLAGYAGSTTRALGVDSAGKVVTL